MIFSYKFDYYYNKNKIYIKQVKKLIYLHVYFLKYDFYFLQFIQITFNYGFIFPLNTTKIKININI